jgi:MscS family membrane protein
VFLKLFSKTKNRYDDILFKSLEAPILLGIMLIAIWVAAIRLDLEYTIHEHISNSYKVLAVLNITWFFVRLFISLLEELVRKADEKSKAEGKHFDNKLLPLTKRFVTIFIWSIGIVIALRNVGVNVKALLGTLGIGGIALALASQDTIKNIIGGITLFVDKPFRIGDRIIFDNIDGNVEDIGIRSTRIRTLDKRLLTIPNYKIVDAVIQNVSGEPKRRVLMKIGLTYNTAPEKMQEAINILKSMPQIIKEVDSKDLAANFTDFGDSALVITYIYYIKKSSPDVIASQSKVNFEILTKFNQAGLDFAFPTRTIYIEKS